MDGEKAISGMRLTAAICIAGGVLVLATRGFARTSGVGNDASTDCFTEFDGVSSNPVVCADGDPSCDADGRDDGQCTFHLALCINQTDLAGCTPAPPLRSVRVRPRKTALRPPADLAASTCGD